MKIFVMNGYSRQQKGDSALLAVTINQLSKAFPGSNITAQLMEKTTINDSYEGANVIDSFVQLTTGRKDIPLFIKPFIVIYVLVASSAWARLTRFFGRHFDWFLTPKLRKNCEEIYLADLCVAVGGGLYCWKKGPKINNEFSAGSSII